MSIKAQGFELNRTLTNFLANADFGAFATATQAILLKGDSARKQRISGFSFDWRVGLAADINPNHFLQVSLLENVTPNPDTLFSPFPEALGSLRFVFTETANLFQNRCREQLQVPFKLTDGVQYAVVAQVVLGAALAAVSTSFFTVFGYEENTYENTESIYKVPR